MRNSRSDSSQILKQPTAIYGPASSCIDPAQSSASIRRSSKPKRKRPLAWRKMNSAANVRTRMEELAKSGYTPQLRSAEAFATQEANAGRCEMADARIQRFKVERDSAQKGIFIANGASDAPYSQQQRDRLVLRRQELETEMLQQNSIAKQLAAEVTEERSRLDRIGHSDVLLPADHVVWSVLASPGSTVTEGQTILDLADCAHRFVVVDLPEREFEQIKPNAPARSAAHRQ